jgi:hypothetical protein
MQNETDLRTQAQEGGRLRGAFAAMLWLDSLSRQAELPKSGTVADWLLPILVKAWKSNNVGFFQDVLNTVKRNKRKHQKDKVHADDGAKKLLSYQMEAHDWKSQTFSVPELQKITGQSDTTTRRLAKAAGVKIRGRGIH